MYPWVRACEPLVDPREEIQAASTQGLQGAAPVSQVAGILEPAVRVEAPVDRLHPVIRECDHRRLFAVEPLRVLDQLGACSVDGLVDPDYLVAGLSRIMGRMLGIQTVPTEVPREVGAHEVDAEQAELRLEIHRRPADVCDQVDVPQELGREPVEILPPALGHRVVCGHEVGMGLVDPLRCSRGEDRRTFGPAVARDDHTVDRFRWVGERDRDVGRTDADLAQRPPERSTGTAGRALDPVDASVRIRGEVEDPVAARVEPGQEGRPGGRGDRRNRGAEGTERALAGEAPEGRHASLCKQVADEVVVGPVEAETEDPHEASSER